MTIKNSITLILSWLLVIVSVLAYLLTDIALNNKHFIGIGILTIQTFINFRNKKLFNYLFLIILILGTVNLINFFYLTINFKFSFIEFNPIFFILCLIFLITNPAFLDEIFKFFETKKTENDNELKEKERELKILNFEESLKNKDRNELEKISKEDSGYTFEAKKAARNLLEHNALQQRFIANKRHR